MEHTTNIRIDESGNAFVVNELGDQIMLTPENILQIWQHKERQLSEARLKKSRVVAEDPDLLADLTLLAEYYNIEKDEIVNQMHQTILRLAIARLDYENWEEEDAQLEGMDED